MTVFKVIIACTLSWPTHQNDYRPSPNPPYWLEGQRWRSHSPVLFFTCASLIREREMERGREEETGRGSRHAARKAISGLIKIIARDLAVVCPVRPSPLSSALRSNAIFFAEGATPCRRSRGWRSSQSCWFPWQGHRAAWPPSSCQKPGARVSLDLMHVALPCLVCELPALPLAMPLESLPLWRTRW